MAKAKMKAPKKGKKSGKSAPKKGKKVKDLDKDGY